MSNLLILISSLSPDSEIKGDILFLGHYESEFDWSNETAKVKLTRFWNYCLYKTIFAGFNILFFLFHPLEKHGSAVSFCKRNKKCLVLFIIYYHLLKIKSNLKTSLSRIQNSKQVLGGCLQCHHQKSKHSSIVQCCNTMSITAKIKANPNILWTPEVCKISCTQIQACTHIKTPISSRLRTSEHNVIGSLCVQLFKSEIAQDYFSITNNMRDCLINFINLSPACSDL